MSAHDAGKDAKKGAAGDNRQPGHRGTQRNKQSEAAVTRNVQAIMDLERRLLEDRKQCSRISDVFTRMAASPAFIAGHLVVFAGWIILNTTRASFDPRPFDLLN